MLVVDILQTLVKYAQHLVQMVVYLTMQPWYLHDDTVVRQTVHERIRHSLGHQLAVIVIRSVADIEHRLLYVTNLMPEKVDGHHWERIFAVLASYHIFSVAILHAKVLAEAQGFRFQPRFLQLNQYQALFAIFVTDGSGEINAEH